MGIFADMSERIIDDMDDAVETVYYTSSGGVELTISAHVFRGAPSDAPQPQAQPTINNQISIYISNEDVATVTLHADKVRVARNRGDATLISMAVRKIEDQDAGSWTLILG